MLCHKCIGIHFRPVEDVPLAIGEVVPDQILEQLKACLSFGVSESPPSLFYLHSINLADLEATADQGCHFCLTIRHRLSNGPCFPLAPYNLLIAEHIFLGIPAFDLKTSPELAQCKLSLHCRQETLQWDCRSHPPESIRCLLDALADPEHSTNDATATDNIFSHRIDDSTLSEANMALAIAWKDTCMDHHDCGAVTTRDSALPTRVINVENPEQLVLEDGRCRRHDYLTLSYRWGTITRFLTSSRNITHHYRMIPHKDLPKTFQDAIYVTRRLGFKYLWIDALCIVHDSLDDLRKEISRMGDIYRGSWLTIFGEIGDGAESGLANERDPRSLKPCRLQLTATLEGRTVTAGTYVEYYPTYYIDSSPLYRRGWVLQEQMLSLRQLRFGRLQIRWECKGFSARESQAAAGLQSPQSLGESWFAIPATRMRSWLQQGTVHQDIKDTKDGLFASWYGLIENYSLRSLTHDSDVLLAIAGIAQVIANHYHVCYTNGLWKEDLQAGLLWIVDQLPVNSKPLPMTNLAFPSWTWVRQWGKRIKFLNEYHGRVLHMLQIIPEREDGGDLSLTTSRGEYHRLDLCDGRFQNASTRPLTLQGFVFKGTMYNNRSRPGTRKDTDEFFDNLQELEGEASRSRLVIVSDTKQVFDNFGLLLDTSTLIQPIRQITCLLCTISAPGLLSEPGLPGWPTPVIRCLALIPTKQPGEYKRVGMLSWTFPDEVRGVMDPVDLVEHLPPWCRTKPKEAITLV